MLDQFLPGGVLMESQVLENLEAYFRRLGSPAYKPWVIVCELLLIGVVVYSVLWFLRGTRGARLMKSVAVILLFSFLIVRVLAEEFAWERINVIYPYFISGVFLIALVVFQPELRRALMRLGQTGWLRTLFRQSDTLIEQIATACESLSRRKIGAIMAIEREVHLSALAESGVKLDSELSAELLETIFWPGSKLHDMGVIIQQGRIAAARCQFPLSESAEVDSTLGARHRAALGLSHDSDAVVIVVSEETGIISVAEHGRWHRPLTPAELAKLLQSRFEVKRRRMFGSSRKQDQRNAA